MVTFLNPIPALAAAAIAIPLLLLLYFLKLRRRDFKVPSTLLWQKAIEDLQANAPFQRLRLTWLLILQLLLLVLMLLALARPLLGIDSGEGGRRTIILMDVSASMGARTGINPISPRRIDLARNQAIEMVEELAGRHEAGEIAIVALAARARTVCSFTTDLRILRRALEGLEPTDEVGLLNPALRLAGAMSRSDAEAEDERALPRLILFSDGRFADQEPFISPPAEMEHVRIPGDSPDDPDHEASPSSTSSPTSPNTDNLGIILLSAHRALEDPASVEVLCGLINGSAKERVVAVRFELDGQLVEIKTIRVPRRSNDAVPGEAGLSVRMTNTDGGVLRASLAGRDLLDVDDSAALVLEAARQTAVLVVSPSRRPNPFLMDVLEEMSLREIVTMGGGEFAALASLPMEDRRARLASYELIVFSGVSPSFVPEIPTISFGASPPIPGLSWSESSTANRRLLSWDNRHPVMRHVALDNLAVADSRRLAVPPGSNILALAEGGAVIVEAWPPNGGRHLVVAFDLMQSNWPVQVSFAIFLQNAFDTLTDHGRREAGRFVLAHQTTTVRALPGATTITVRGPVVREIGVRENGTAVVGALGLTGLYTIENAVPEDETLAVNLLSAEESDLRPVDDLRFSGGAMASGLVDETAPREIWWWFVAAAAGLLMLEWFVYGMKSRI